MGCEVRGRECGVRGEREGGSGSVGVTILSCAHSY